MSYPDLGCFAECLECELCEEGLDLGGGSNDDIDLFDFDLDYDSFEGDSDFDGVPDWADDDWGPPPLDEGGIFDDLPGGIPLGDDLELTPTWDPMGVEVHGEF